MIIRKPTAILAAIFLITVCNQAEARKHKHHRYHSYSQQVSIQEFCGERYCSDHSRNIVTQAVSHANPHKVRSTISISYGGLLSRAEQYLGTNPTGWNHVWCGRFMAMIAPDKAALVKNPNWARDWARLPGAHRGIGSPGDIVVLSRGRGGHIGVLKGYDGRGNPIIISGNHGRSVGEGVYSASRVIAYVPG